MNIPLQPSFLRIILRDIVTLFNKFEKKDLLQFENWKGNICNVVAIPVCKSKASFMKLNNKFKFIDNLAKYVGIELDAAEWIVLRMARLYENEFIKVGLNLGLIHNCKKMDNGTAAAAMWEEANCNTKQQRIMLRYLRATFGRKSINGMATSIKRVDEKRPEGSIMYLGCKDVEPVYNEVEIDGETISYFHKPLQRCVSTSIGHQIVDPLAIRSVDLVIGGDHGARKFRMIMKIIVRDELQKSLDSWTMKIGHIDCVHDSYEILRATIMPSLNNELKELKDLKLVVYKKVQEDGTVQEVTSQVNQSNSPFVHPTTNVPCVDFEVVNNCDIRLIMTGDLAFYAAVVGKPNMSGNWCHWCQLSPKEWQAKDHDKGECWTLTKMSTLREQLYTNEVKDEPNNRKGVRDIVLMDSIDIHQYVFPILHAEIGLGNYLLNQVMDWIDYRIENVPDEELEKRENYASLLIGLEEKQNEMEEFNRNEGSDLVDKKIERSELIELRSFRDEEGNYLHSPAEKRMISEMIHDLGVNIKQLQLEVKRRKAVIKLKRECLNKEAKELASLRKKRGKKGEIRIELEKVLKKHGIERPPYHGGDLTGVKVQVLFQNVDVIFGEFQEKVMAIQDRRADDDEVRQMFEMYIKLGFILDGIFSLARTKTGYLEQEDIDLQKRFVRSCIHMWRCLRFSSRGPKIHGIEDHLLDSMQMYKGVGDFVEDFIEQSHQFGVKQEMRTRNLSRNKAFKSHSRWEWMANRIVVQKAKAEMKSRSTRKRKSEGISRSIQNKNEKKVSRDTKRLLALEAVENGNYSIIENYKVRKNRNDED